jgi:DNA-binding winged helix-turn-helix (wHTH) protein/tetratricopeptide (TPR) repeat protein
MERDEMCPSPPGVREERAVYYFGPFALDVARGRLFRRGNAIRITSKALRLLQLLVDKPGVTLSTQEITSNIWGDPEEATEHTLRQHVLMLRHALEDNVTERYIATDYGRGYRFVGEVTQRPPSFMTGVVEQYCAAAEEFRSSGSSAGLMAALHLYDRALAIDDSNAPALGGSAMTRVFTADFQYDRPRELLETANEQGEAALRAQPDCIDAVLALCKVRLDYFWDFAGALELAQQALRIDAHHRVGAFMYPWILALSSRSSEATAFIDSLPKSVSQQNIIATCRGVATLFSGDYQAGTAELEAVCRIWPDYWFARTFRALGLLVTGKEREALAIFDDVRHSAYDPLVDRQMNARYFAEGYALYTRFRIGDVDGARSGIERLRRLAESQFIPATIFALAELGRKDYPEAQKCIRQCRDNRECWYTHLAVDPLVKELHLDPAELYGPPAA